MTSSAQLAASTLLIASFLCAPSHAATDEETQVPPWSEHLESARKAAYAGDFAKARKEADAALDAHRAVKGDYAVRLTILDACGGNRAAQGHLAEARELLAGALKLGEKHLPFEHEATVNILVNLAGVEVELGDLESAWIFVRDATKRLARWEKSRARLHAANISIARILRISGEYKRAKAVAAMSFRARRSKFGPNHPQTALPALQLAAIASEAGDLQYAEGQFEAVLVVLEPALGQSHPRMALLRLMLALVKSRLGRHSDAVEIVEPLMRDLDSRTDVSTADRAVMFEIAGEVYLAAGRIDGAAGACQQSLGYWGKSGQALTPDRFDAIHLMGLIHVRRHESAAARKRFQVAYDNRLKVLGERHPDTAISAIALGLVEIVEGDREDGTKRAQAAIEVLSETLTDKHPEVIGARARLAELTPGDQPEPQKSPAR